MSELSRRQDSPAPVHGDEVSVLELISVLVRRWRVLGVAIAISSSVALSYSLLAPPTFTATTTFVPEAQPQRGLPVGLAGVAATLGISLGTEGSQSPRFYAEIVKSRDILVQTLEARYADPRSSAAPGDSVTFLELVGPGGQAHADSIYQGLRVLGRLISVGIDNQTSIVRVRVDCRYPQLAAAVANRLIDNVNEFNAKRRQSKARLRRLFIEDRIADAERELSSAEGQLRTFYERNRTWESAPQLRFEEGRLRRQVDIRQEVFLTLRREHEVARIEEVNDSPVITVIDRAVTPLPKTAPRPVLLLGLALAIGSALGLLGVLVVEYLHRLRTNEAPEYRELSELTKRLVGGLGRKIR